MPQQAQTYWMMDNGGVAPDISPAFGQGGKTWTQTNQAIRRRLNFLGDKDGSPVATVTFTVASGFTGSILLAQMVGVQAIRPIDYTKGLISRAAVVCLQSATGVNATATSSVWMSSATGAANIMTIAANYTGSTLPTVATTRFFQDGNLNATAMREPGYLCIELGVNIAASTVAGSVTLYLGSASSTLVVANQTGTVTTSSPWLYLSPDNTTLDNANYLKLRAEGSVAANIGQ